MEKTIISTSWGGLWRRVNKMIFVKALAQCPVHISPWPTFLTLLFVECMKATHVTVHVAIPLRWVLSSISQMRKWNLGKVKGVTCPKSHSWYLSERELEAKCVGPQSLCSQIPCFTVSLVSMRVGARNNDVSSPKQLWPPLVQFVWINEAAPHCVRQACRTVWRCSRALEIATDGQSVELRPPEWLFGPKLSNYWSTWPN